METRIKAKVLSDGESVDYDLELTGEVDFDETVLHSKVTFNCESKKHATTLKKQLDRILNFDVYEQESPK